MKYDLAILIPARNEMFLRRTVEDIIAHREGKTQIIVVLDGWETDLPEDPHLTVIRHPEPLGQRASINEAAAAADAKYLMKVDAHCTFDQGFDRIMVEDMQDDATMVPMMKNLHAFDWVCTKGHRRYQGPEGPCKEDLGQDVLCGEPTHMKVVWKAKDSPRSVAYCFDSTPHFQYFKGFQKRPEGKGDITETMSLQGSCFMCTKERFFALGLCDESLGSWGSQGIEVALKTWLSGGRVLCNHKTWYAHLFRTQPGFGFPYKQNEKQIQHAKQTMKELFYDNKWPLQTRPLSWLLEHFWPITMPHPTEHGKTALAWTEQELEILKSWNTRKKKTKAVVYYTHNICDPQIFRACQVQLTKGMKEKHIITVSREPLQFGARNIVIPKIEGWLDMFEKILRGLEETKADVVFLCEHDVLYHPSHFDFIPARKDTFYYNTNVFKWKYPERHFLYVDDCKQLSGLVADRELLLAHYRERVRRVKAEGFTRGNGFEPGTRTTKNGGYDDFRAEAWQSKFPNIDIRHEANATQNRWRKDQFRNQKYTEGWKEVQTVPGWSVIESGQWPTSL